MSKMMTKESNGTHNERLMVNNPCIQVKICAKIQLGIHTAFPILCWSKVFVRVRPMENSVDGVRAVTVMNAKVSKFPD